MYHLVALPTVADPSKQLSINSNMSSYPLPPSPAVIIPPQHSQQPVSWMHTIPSYMPWSVQQRLGNENVMKFTAESVSLTEPNMTIPVEPATSYEELPQSSFQRTVFQHKRKGSHLDEAPLPNKLYVSEDKMVAHLNELHISNSYECNRSNADKDITCRKSARSLEELEGRLDLDIDEVDDSSGPSSSNEAVVVLSPELLQLQKANNILPGAILEKLQKPSMELVLWKPPGGIVDSLIKAVTSKSTDSLQNTDCQRKPINNNRSNNNNNDVNSNDKSSGQPIFVNRTRAFNERLNNTAVVAPSTPRSVLTTHNVLLDSIDDDEMEL